MGASGHRNFENDSASDFVSEFKQMPSEAALLEVLTVVAEMGEEDEYIEADEAGAALAAAEIVAAALGRPGPDFPADLQPAVVQLSLGEDSDVQDMALDAVEAVLRASELKEQWEETPKKNEWLAVQQDLLARLQ